MRVGPLEPKSDHAGLRGSRDIARQITTRLIEMEQAHFTEHPASRPAGSAGAVS